MSTKNNQQNIPQAREAMDQFKMLIKLLRSTPSAARWSRTFLPDEPINSKESLEFPQDMCRMWST